MRALSPRPVRTACLMHSSLMTGSMPGMAASTRETCALGSPPNAVEAPGTSFDCEATWAWTSMPTTTSQSPVAPLMSFELGAAVFIIGSKPLSPHRPDYGNHCPGEGVGSRGSPEYRGPEYRRL